jgi:hypothetical protein
MTMNSKEDGKLLSPKKEKMTPKRDRQAATCKDEPRSERKRVVTEEPESFNKDLDTSAAAEVNSDTDTEHVPKLRRGNRPRRTHKVVTESSDDD